MTTINHNVESSYDFETISELFYNSDQSWFYKKIVKSSQTIKATLRVEIRRNSYDDQSYLRGYVFCKATQSWNLIVSEPLLLNSNCYVASYSNPNEKCYDFCDDADDIIETMFAILRD